MCRYKHQNNIPEFHSKRVLPSARHHLIPSSRQQYPQTYTPCSACILSRNTPLHGNNRIPVTEWNDDGVCQNHISYQTPLCRKQFLFFCFPHQPCLNLVNQGIFCRSISRAASSYSRQALSRFLSRLRIFFCRPFFQQSNISFFCVNFCSGESIKTYEQ